MNKVSISIHGSCVSRDLFEYDSSGTYEIKENIARNSIFSSIQPPIDINHYAVRPMEMNWQDRMIMIDSTKTLFSRLCNNKSDYLLIDLIDERFQLNLIGGTCLTWTANLKGYAPSLESAGKIVHASDFSSDRLTADVQTYCRMLRTVYMPEQILILRAKFVDWYRDANGRLTEFSTDRRRWNNKLNGHIRFLYDVLEKELCCRSIELPAHAIATENHKWGLAPMHYEPEIYDVFLQSITELIQT